MSSTNSFNAQPKAETDINAALFVNLVVMLGSSAMQQIGKALSSAKQKAKNNRSDIEKDLESAQMSIDMLDMLQAKTKGNLSADEERILSETLTSLKLSYIETSKQVDNIQPSDADSTPAKPETSAANGDMPSTDAETTNAAEQEARRKFHKSYGSDNQKS